MTEPTPSSDAPTTAAAVPAGPARVLTLPTAGVRALRQALLDVPDGAERLRDAGHAAGAALFDGFADEIRAATGHDVAGLPLPRFMRLLGERLAAQGWGTVTLEHAAGGEHVGLRAVGWAEAELAEPGPHPQCHLSTGLFAGFFGRLAGQPLAVLEVECRAAGGAACRFLVGSPAGLERVHRQMPGSADR